MNTKLKLAISVVLAVVVAVGLGLWWLLSGDAPDEVSIEAATEQLGDSAQSETSSASSTASTDGIEGQWVVDTETGEFDFETASGSFVGFRIEEELSRLGEITAVGRTGDVDGSIEIEGTMLVAASFEADLTTVTTNDSMRDDKVQNALETGQFPSATFVLTEPVDLGADAASGATVAVTVSGDLTIHGVTTPIELDIEAQLVDGIVVLVGSVELVFSDYGVEVPTSPMIISVDDFGVLEMQLLLAR